MILPSITMKIVWPVLANPWSRRMSLSWHPVQHMPRADHLGAIGARHAVRLTKVVPSTSGSIVERGEVALATDRP